MHFQLLSPPPDATSSCSCMKFQDCYLHPIKSGKYSFLQAVPLSWRPSASPSPATLTGATVNSSRTNYIFLSHNIMYKRAHQLWNNRRIRIFYPALLLVVQTACSRYSLASIRLNEPFHSKKLSAMKVSVEHLQEIGTYNSGRWNIN